MEVLCRTAGGKDPLGDVVLTLRHNEGDPKTCILKGLPLAEKHNRYYKQFRRAEKQIIVTLQCGDLIYNMKTGKFSSLSGKIPTQDKPQPDLDMPSKTEPRLF